MPLLTLVDEWTADKLSTTHVKLVAYVDVQTGKHDHGVVALLYRVRRRAQPQCLPNPVAA